MTDLLLDTHSFIWWTTDYKKLSSEAYNAICDPSREVYVSAVSAIEINIKRAIKQLQFDADIDQLIEEKEFSPLPINNKHAKYLATLPFFHRDPFDRLLIAQALAGGLILVTADSELMKYNVPIIRA